MTRFRPAKAGFRRVHPSRNILLPCRDSVMAGDRLNRQQAEHQRDRLIGCLDPFTCPHGRPAVPEMSEEFLNKQFLR